VIAKAVPITTPPMRGVFSTRLNIFQMRNENSRSLQVKTVGTITKSASINAVASGPLLKVETWEECVHYCGCNNRNERALQA